MPESFLGMPRWRTDLAGRSWLDRLPHLVEEQCERWRLRLDGRPRHGSNALVVPVARDDEQYVLRLGPPGDPVDAEVRALRFWAGRGTVLLIDADIARRATLLERLDPHRTLLGVDLVDSIRVLAGLTRTLAVPAPSDVPSTQEIAARFVEGVPPRWSAVGSPTTPRVLARVLEAAARCATSVGDAEAVDGDLHFEQVLAGGRSRWTVVDPVLLRGDREYDLGRVLWTRLDELAADDAVRRAFDEFVDAAEVPRDRARDWVQVRAMSYLVWGLEHGLTIDPPRCQRLLRIFR